MKLRKKLFTGWSIAFIVLALAGCGTAVETSGNEDSNTGSGNDDSGIVAGSVVASLTEVGEAGSHQYVFELKNDTTEDAKLSMNSSQFFEYQLLDSAGTVQYTYSADKSFTQMLQEKVLKPGETFEMEIDATEGLQNLVAGTYTLVVWSTATEGDFKDSTEVTWEGGATGSATSGEKLLVEEASVTFVGLQDQNSIEVTNDQNETEAMRLNEEAKSIFSEMEKGTKITVFYVIIDGQKIIQTATYE